MNEPFDIPVLYQGEELYFPAKLLQLGYTHHFRVDVYGIDVLFEPDEDRVYRAIIEPSQLQSSKVEVELLKAISKAIDAIVN